MFAEILTKAVYGGLAAIVAGSIVYVIWDIASPLFQSRKGPK